MQNAQKLMNLRANEKKFCDLKCNAKTNCKMNLKMGRSCHLNEVLKVKMKLFESQLWRIQLSKRS